MNPTETKKYWQEEEGILKKINSQGVEKYFKELKSLKKAFSLSDRSVRCIDEGTPGGIHLAGAGILLDPDQALNILIEAHADAVFSHEECGAAALSVKNKDLDVLAEDYGKEWAEKLAKKAKIPYKDHIGIKQMKRPAGLHTARVIYYDGTGRFDYSKVEGMPKGFIISRKYLDPDYAIKELDIAVQIAFGHHGFGELFTKKQPLFVIILASSNVESEKLTVEVGSITEKYKDRVRVERFVENGGQGGI